MTIMLPRNIAVTIMTPYQSINPVRNYFDYNQMNVAYNSHIEYNYSEIGGLMGVRVLASTTMKGRTNGSL